MTQYKSLKETAGFKNTPMGFAMTFENGYTIAVQWGPGNYCASRNQDGVRYSIRDNPFTSEHKTYESHTAEVAAWKPDGTWLRLGEHDDVVGWVTADRVAQYITVLSGATPEKAIYLSWPECRFKSTKEAVASWLGL